MDTQENMQTLERFLNMPLSDGGEIFRLFSQLPGAVSASGPEKLQRYVYVPGTREDAVVLVAHADTVWDSAYGNPHDGVLALHNGFFYSQNPDCGIGADDRAGCAMLWALRNSGHSLLVLDGEERGKHGARYLRTSNKQLFQELNRHRFMMEFDWKGTGGCLYDQVDNTKVFQQHIAQRLGFQDDRVKGGCDLQILCHKICGVNVGVGYHSFHMPQECLCVSEWENTLEKVCLFLQQPQPRFPVSIPGRCLSILRKVKHGIGGLLRRLRLKK